MFLVVRPGLIGHILQHPLSFCRLSFFLINQCFSEELQLKHQLWPLKICSIFNMQRSFSFAIFSISVYLLFIVVDRVSADDCNPGFSSPGCKFFDISKAYLWYCNQCFPSLAGMFPRGDVSVELGKDLTMFCGVNSTHPNGKNYSWKNLSFLIDNKTAATPWVVEKENETSIRLSLNQTTLAPDDYYRVSCTLNDMGICTRFVYVGCKLSVSVEHQSTTGG